MNEYVNDLIERNQSAIGNICEFYSKDKAKYLSGIMWAKELNSRLGTLDLEQKNIAIEQIEEKLNNDFVNLAGGTLEEKISRSK